jgi:hypothetical protein
MEMKIFSETKDMVEVEQRYTRKILKKLMIIERDKLYADLKYPSLHKFLIKALGYSEAESTLRVNVVRLMNSSEEVTAKVIKGEMSLSNASEAQKAIKKIKDPKRVKVILDAASEKSTRGFKDFIQVEVKQERREVIVLKEFMLKKFDRLKKKFGEVSNYEVLQILVEKELMQPEAMQRSRKISPKVSRSIPKSVKVQVYTGKCANCGKRHGLEYDHKVKFSHGGTNGADNIQMLCRSCNMRKEIVAREMGVFV